MTQFNSARYNRIYNNSLELRPFNVNSIVKRPVYLHQKKYCADITQKQSNQLLFSIYKTHDESEIFKFLVQDKSNNLCFDITEAGSYYFIVNPVKKRSTITKFNIVNKGVNGAWGAMEQPTEGL